jgi:hypothetical protein
MSCQNKVLQKGLLVKLELFKTENKVKYCSWYGLSEPSAPLASYFNVVKILQGWAIRAAEPIPQGTFVCEYIGELVKGDDAMTHIERFADSLLCSFKLNEKNAIIYQLCENTNFI